MSEQARPPAADRLRAAPLTLWVEAGLLTATPLLAGFALAGYGPADVRAFAGLGAGILLGVGLLLRWRVAWAFALLVDALLVLATTRLIGSDPVVGGIVLARGIVGLVILLLPSTGAHVFGSGPFGSWWDTDEADETDGADPARPTT